MGTLRIAGWLRFRSKAQLNKGLASFRAQEFPECFDASQWEVDGLDARVRIETEHPGDYNHMELPFCGMLRAASDGYLDFYEDSNALNQQHRPGLVKRWTRRAYDKLFKRGMSDQALIVGTSTHGAAGGSGFTSLRGELLFDSAANAAAARSGFLLPYVSQAGLRQVEVVGSGEGNKAEFDLRIGAPLADGISTEVEGCLVAWAQAVATSAKGSLTIASTPAKGKWKQYRTVIVDAKTDSMKLSFDPPASSRVTLEVKSEKVGPSPRPTNRLV